MAKLLADENLPFPTVVALRNLGHDIQTLAELNLAGIALPDEEVLQAATIYQRCVVTFNRLDFIRLHQRSSQHAGIVICTFDTNYTDLATRIHAVLEDVDLAGQLLRVQRRVI
jgi:predicted nuclease of predicted toxin-antitoxin system